MSKFADIQIDPGIVKRAARGDVRAHEIIYRAFATPVYSLCLRFTRVPAHAEDLTQETFIEIMRSIAKFRGEAALGSWIRRIAVTKSLMFLRSAKNAGFKVPDAPIDEAITYVERCFQPRYGTFTYITRPKMRPSRAMAGAGIVSLALSGEYNTKMARSAARYSVLR